MTVKPEKEISLNFSGSGTAPICVRISPGMSAQDVIARYLPQLQAGEYHFWLVNKKDFVTRDVDLWPLVPQTGETISLIPRMKVAC